MQSKIKFKILDSGKETLPYELYEWRNRKWFQGEWGFIHCYQTVAEALEAMRKRAVRPLDLPRYYDEQGQIVLPLF